MEIGILQKPHLRHAQWTAKCCVGKNLPPAPAEQIRFSMSKVDPENEISEKVEGLITYLKQERYSLMIIFLLIPTSPPSKIHSSYDVARRTVLLMRDICAKTRWANAM